jgi:hypothetical protein
MTSWVLIAASFLATVSAGKAAAQPPQAGPMEARCAAATALFDAAAAQWPKTPPVFVDAQPRHMESYLRLERPRPIRPKSPVDLPDSLHIAAPQSPLQLCPGFREHVLARGSISPDWNGDGLASRPEGGVRPANFILLTLPVVVGTYALGIRDTNVGPRAGEGMLSLLQRRADGTWEEIATTMAWIS